MLHLNMFFKISHYIYYLKCYITLIDSFVNTAKLAKLLRCMKTQAISSAEQCIVCKIDCEEMSCA